MGKTPIPRLHEGDYIEVRGDKRNGSQSCAGDTRTRVLDLKMPGVPRGYFTVRYHNGSRNRQRRRKVGDNIHVLRRPSLIEVRTAFPELSLVADQSEHNARREPAKRT